MTSRERVKRALNREEPDRIPINDNVWEATVERWKKEGFPEGNPVSEYFNYDMARFIPDLSPRFPQQVIQENGEYIIKKNSFGELIRNHKDYSTTPQVIDSFVKTKRDWEKVRERLLVDESRPIYSKMAISYEKADIMTLKDALKEYQKKRKKGKFILYTAMIGYDCIQRYLGSEKLLYAIATDPRWTKEMYLTQAKLVIEMCDLMMKKGFEFDGAWLCSDLGYKNDVLFSPECYKTQLFPADKMVCDYFKSKDMPVILHSDGCVKKFIPLFIEAGFSCLQPLEVKAGMDVRQLKKKYGDRISFMGGIDTRAMAHPDPQVIEREIRDKFQIAKQGGGYIYHSDHSIPPNVSFEQYKRVMRLVSKYGKY